MSGPCFHAGAMLLVAVVIVSKVKAEPSNEDLFLDLVRERSNCKRGICRRNVDKNSAEIVERDAISRLSNSFEEDKNSMEKRRCISWRCRQLRTIDFDNDKVIGQDKRTNRNDFDIDKIIGQDKRTVSNDVDFDNDKIMAQDKRTIRNDVDFDNGKLIDQDKLTISNDLDFDSDKIIDQDKRAISDDVDNDKVIAQQKREQIKRKRCLKCNPKRTAKTMKVALKPAKKCLGWKCRSGKRENGNNRKYKNLDTKRSILTQVLEKQEDGEGDGGCLSWDCKRDNVEDITADKKEEDSGVDSDGRGNRFREYLMERRMPRFDWVSTDVLRTIVRHLLMPCLREIGCS